MQVEMQLESYKKNSVRYNADPDVANPCVTSIYIMKHALPETAPDTVLVTITLEEGK